MQTHRVETAASCVTTKEKRPADGELQMLYSHPCRLKSCDLNYYPPLFAPAPAEERDVIPEQESRRLELEGRTFLSAGVSKKKNQSQYIISDHIRVPATGST